MKMIPKIVPKKIDPDAVKQLDNLYVMIEQLAKQKSSIADFLNGQILKDLSITTTNTIFPHSLLREWSGYIVTKRSNAQIPYNTATLTSDKKNGIELVAAGTVTIDLYIF
jgi:hypothetical protein